MTDFSPIDSDHLSDEEFMALCPQGEHAPGPEPLSPAAQAVMIAATNGNENVINDPVYKQCIAAALRAAADQVVPSPCFASDDVIHERIFAIAAELEGAQ